MKRWAAVTAGALLLGSLNGSAMAQDAAKKDMPPPPPAPAVVASAPVCNACNACDDCCSHGGVYAGIGIMWLQPNFHNDPAFTTASVGALTQGTTATVAQQDFRHHLEASPVVWLGFSSASGVGAQVSWWHYNQSSFEEGTPPTDLSVVISAGPLLGIGAIVPPGSGDTLFTGSKIQFDVWDFDATYRYLLAQGWLQLGAGIRYAHFSQDYGAFTNDPTNAEALIASHNFNGAGPTLALEGHYRVGSSAFGVYGKARGALLFGTTNEHVDWQNLLATVISNTTANLHAETHEADTIPFASLELGAEYSRRMGQGEVFVQAGLVAQEWWGAGSSANFDGLILRSGSRSDLGLIGWSLQLGYHY